MINYQNIKHLTLGELGDKLIEIKQKRKGCESEIEELKKDFAVVGKRIKEIMEEQGICTYDADSGKVSLKQNVRGEIENNTAFFLWLMNKGDEGLAHLNIGPALLDDDLIERIRSAEPDDVKLSVAWNRLASYLNENCDVLDPDTWPDGVHVNTFETVDVSLKR